MSGKKGANIRPPSRLLERDPAVVYQDINETWVTLEELYQELGRAMSEARRSQGLSQSDAGKRLGISRDMVCLYELGRRWKHDGPGIERLALSLSQERG